MSDWEKCLSRIYDKQERDKSPLFIINGSGVRAWLEGDQLIMSTIPDFKNAIDGKQDLWENVVPMSAEQVKEYVDAKHDEIEETNRLLKRMTKLAKQLKGKQK